MKNRPPQQLVNPAALRDMGEDTERKWEPGTGLKCMYYAVNFYKLGYLYKTVKLTALVSTFCSFSIC